MFKKLFFLFLLVSQIGIAKAIDHNRVDSLEHLLNTTTTDTLLFDYNYSIALEFIKFNPDSSLFYVNRSLRAINEHTYHLRYIDGSNLKAACYWFNNDLDSALKIYYDVLLLTKRFNETRKTAKISNNIGIIYQYKGTIDSSEKYFIQACQIYDSLNIPKAFAKASLDLGALYTSLSKYDLAIDNLLRALSTFEEIKDTTYLIHGYNGLGNLYLNIDEAETALDYYQKALKLTKIYSKTDISDELLCNVGLTYFQGLNNYDSADFYFNKALSKEGIENNHFLYSTILVNLATLKNNQGKYKEALKYFKIVKNLEYKHIDPYSQMVCSVNMGNTYLEMGNLKLASENILIGLEKAKSLDNLEFQKNAYQYLSRVDSLKGDYKNALGYYQKYYIIALKIHNTEIEERIHKINSQHQLKQIQSKNKLLAKQNELKQDLIGKHIKLNILTAVALALSVLILLFTFYMYYKTRRLNKNLQTKNEQISKQKDELETLNNQLNKLISIIAHDLKAPFNALIGLLNELNTNSEYYTEEEKVIIIKGLLQNTMSTYRLLENLMEWSVSKTGLLKMNIEKIDIFSMINEVIALNKLQLENKNLSINNQLNPQSDVYGDYKMTFTILTNLINNAIKFSNTKGLITISSEKKEHFIMIHISDEGIGIPHRYLETIFSIDSEYQTQGTENEYGTGLGLKVVAEFVSRMGGSVYVISEEKIGSTFSFELPTTLTDPS